MAYRVPFVAYFKITPEQTVNGKRVEIVRSREKISYLVYSDLMDNFQDVYGNITIPGGNVHLGIADASNFSFEQGGVAIKPQFGESPDTLTVVGFFNDPTTTPYYNAKQVIHANKVLSGPATGAPGPLPGMDPSTGSWDAVNAIRDAFDASITSANVELIRLELNGVAFGREARHFPRRTGSA